MTRHIVLSLAAGFCLSATCACATTLDFEGLPQNALHDGYGGLVWTNFEVMEILDPTDPSQHMSGITSGTGFAFNPEDGPSSFASSAAFTLNGFFLTDPWNDGFSVLVQGFLAGVQTHSQLLTGFTGGPVAVNLDWTNIDDAHLYAFLTFPDFEGGVRFDRSFILDDLRLNNPIASVPLPATLPLLALTLAAFGLAARRRAA